MKPTILIIENNSNDEMLAQMAFDQVAPRINVVVRRNGAEALDYLLWIRQSGDTYPHLILLDLKMPKLGGMEVLRQVKFDDHTRFIPIVVFSSSAEPEDILNAYLLGANSYIQKPMDFNELIYIATYIKLYWLDWNQLPSRY